ncbi:1,5-anhydro-D-fructose reductase [Podospora australis]|uniref:1,5-anhydro-D-fructose reductase n=1 Tax=Podospora australis TaxID=1536484 RepID=A0AAN6WK59_9PEZI|nr:1,5-anhydro-D-fructose reductase [Podospora australis]
MGNNGHKGPGEAVVLPSRPPFSMNPPRLLVIGAGSRGRAYARAVKSSTNGILAAVAEPDDYKRDHFGKTMIWGANSPPPEGTAFTDWRDFITYERDRRARAQAGEDGVPSGVDAAFVCVLDEMHHDVVIALAQLGGLHIMCEKPLATNLQDCINMYAALQSNTIDGDQKAVFSIGHVLRYSPHNILLRQLLLKDRVIGDVLSVVHTEPVGFWHFTHSYVRGNWRRENTSAPSLLTKSCHDIDVILWLLCSPPDNMSPQEVLPHLPSTVSSTGSLQYFKRSRKPYGAGTATNCLSCPIEPSCKYSAKRLYVGDKLVGLGSGNKGWPLSIVLPDIESYGTDQERERALLTKLGEDYDSSISDSQVAQRNWFGRCVYESDNDVCDEQVVTITWDEDPLPDLSGRNGEGGVDSPASSDPMRGRGSKTATFHMVAQTKQVCERYTNIYGVDGEIFADSRAITVQDFKNGQTTTYHPHIESLGHGGGDAGLTRQFVLAVDKVKNHGWSSDKAQRELVGCTLDEVIRSHAMVFCAEEARKEKKVVHWSEWWANEVQNKMSRDT